MQKLKHSTQSIDHYREMCDMKPWFLKENIQGVVRGIWKVIFKNLVSI